MASVKSRMHDPIGKYEVVTNSTNTYGAYLTEDKDPMMQELRTENIRLKQENMRLRTEIETSSKSVQILALQRSEEKFSKAFDNNQAAMTITRLKDNELVDVNRKYIELSGYSREEMIGKCALDLWANLPDREHMLQQIDKFGYVENVEIQYQKKYNEIAFFSMTGSFIEIDGEKYLLASNVDITDRRKAEEALGLSQDLLRKTFEVNPLPMLIMSVKNGTFMAVNQSFIDSTDFGFSRKELRGRSAVELNMWVDPNERNEFVEKIRTEGLVRNYEVRFRLKSDESITALLSGVIIYWQGEECVLEVCNDITELRRYQHEMARLDRLNLIGQISASIAHEIRNPMTTVQGFLQLFQIQNRYTEDREFLDLMIQEMDRANAIITEFLSLANNKAVTLRLENLNRRIESLLPVLQAKAKKHDVHIKLKLGDIPNLMMDTDEIRQLILNLALNGIEAMPAGGRLTIKTFRDGNGVTLAIQDQGSGMAPEVLEKIGTPFFTTKAHGTGLGVAVCYSIAHRHHARIWVETGLAGTVFNVFFPLEGEEDTSAEFVNGSTLSKPNFSEMYGSQMD